MSTATTADRRTRVLDAARALFLERGYAETTITAVATRAGFSKRTVYLDFDSKDALFSAVCTGGMARLRSSLSRVLDERRDVLEELEALAAAYLRLWSEEHALFRLLFVIADDETLGDGDAFAAEERAAIGVIARAVDRARAEGVLDRSTDSWSLAIVAWGSLTGVLTLAESSRRAALSGAPIDDLYWQTFHTLVRGAAAPS
jgi:AcrR family transcriptional regulator